MLSPFWYWSLQRSAAGSRAEQAATRSEHAADRASRDARILEDRVERLTIICAAMWDLLQKSSGLSDEDLLKRIHEIDMTDGHLDGKVRREVIDCPACGRTLGRKHRQCMYCGAPRPGSDVFDAV